jgi:hypothetical protein
MTEGKNRIMIYGPKNDGTYTIEFKTAAGEALAISVPAGETRVLKYFQERMPDGLFDHHRCSCRQQYLRHRCSFRLAEQRERPAAVKRNSPG